MILGKKGQEIGFGGIMILMLAIMGLILIMVFWKQGAIDTFLPFFKNLPGFNKVNDTVKEQIIFRYQIAEDKVQYYDGVNWNDFTVSEYPKSKKKFYADKLNEDFEQGYFDPFRKYGLENTDKGIKVDGRSVLLVSDFVAGSKSFSSQTFTNYVVLNDGQFIFDRTGKIFERDKTGGEEIVGQINPFNEPFKETEILKIVIDKGSQAYQQSPAGLRKLHLDKLDGVFFSSQMQIEGSIGKVIVKRDETLSSGTGILPEQYELKCYLDEGSLEQSAEYTYYRNRDVAEMASPTKVDVLCDLYNYGEKMGWDKIKVLLVVDRKDMSKIRWGKIFVPATYRGVYEEIREEGLLKTHPDAAGIPVEKVKEGVWNWLDKILDNPKKIRYFTVQKDKSEVQGEQFICIQRINKDLVADFNKPVSQSTVCP